MNKFNHIVEKYMLVYETQKDLPRSLDEALFEYGWEGEMDSSRGSIVIDLATKIIDICYNISYNSDIPVEWSVRNYCDRVSRMDYEEVKEAMYQLIEMFNDEGIPFTCENVFHEFMDIVYDRESSSDFIDPDTDINNLGNYIK